MKNLDQNLAVTTMPLVPVAEKIKPITPPPRARDLHGMTLQQAYHAVQQALQEGGGSQGSITFVTGKSGKIREEFPRWLEGHQEILRTEELNGGGAFRVVFRKKRG